MGLKSGGRYPSHNARRQAVARHWLFSDAVRVPSPFSPSTPPCFACQRFVLLPNSYGGLRHHICLQDKRRGRARSKSICSLVRESKCCPRTLASRSIMKGHPPSARGKERASGDWMWHEGEKGEGLRDWMWHEGEAWRGKGSSEGQQWRKMSLRVGMEPEG